MTADIRVTAIRIADGSRDIERGILARFDCTVGPVVLTGCALVRNAEGRAIALTPRCRGSASVRMLRDKDHAQLCRIAGEAYGAISGAVAADDG